MTQDIQPHERKALEYAAEQAGEYLESIGLTDLADMSEEQWHTFIEVVSMNFIQKRRELEPCPF